MDKTIRLSDIYEHFEIVEHNVSSFIKPVLESLGTSFSARELCKKVVENFLTSENITITDSINYDNYITQSSSFAVACEYLGLLHSRQSKCYANGRGGVFYMSQPATTELSELLEFECKIVSLREIIEWMIEK